MLNPPFRPALVALATGRHELPDAEPAAPGGRLRLSELDPHLHCSIIGTCLPTAELRRLMARVIEVDGTSDLDVHHEAVRLASRQGDASRSLQRALEHRHAAWVQRFARAKDDAALLALWCEALQAGEVPGAYWAVLTHRRATPELRQRAFGDVHMLSHLVGAANRADIRRLVALEQENAELRERIERQHARGGEVEGALATAQAECDTLRRRLAQPVAAPDAGAALQQALARAAHLASEAAVQAQRRNAAESATQVLRADVERLEAELAATRGRLGELAQELSAAEAQLRDTIGAPGHEASPLAGLLDQRRILYVGGRPSSNPSIRELVLRHGGEYQRHDGGLEDRKGALAPALAWADIVVFPVDCIDHDSAQVLKRACVRQGRRFVPLRTASVASFAAGVAAALAPADPAAGGTRHAGCLRCG